MTEENKETKETVEVEEATTKVEKKKPRRKQKETAKTQKVEQVERRFAVVSKYKDAGIALPQRSTFHSAGYDLCAAETTVIPSLFKNLYNVFMSKGIVEKIKEDIKAIGMKKALKKVLLAPTLIPTGIKVYMPEDNAVLLPPRSSTPSNFGLIMSNGLGIIDADYVDNPDSEGEIFGQFINFLPFDVTVRKGEAICQAIFVQYLKTVDDQPKENKREGGHGSTTKKS